MFHYRWHFKADIELAGKILPRWTGLHLPEESLQAMTQYICEHQISRLYVVGSNDATAPVIEASYLRFLKILDTIIQKTPFMMGQRPGSADFAVYAQLTQLAKFDPTPSAICLREAPRVYAWTDIMDDLSGTEPSNDGFLGREDARDVLGEFLSEVGRVYVPVLLANAKALMSGEKEMETEIDGRQWVQPAFPYQGKCLQWIREEFGKLSADDQVSVKDIVAGTGCEPLFDD
jgi:hypothetical protein